MKNPAKALAFLVFPLAFAAHSIAAPGDEVYQRGFLSIEESHKAIELPEG